MDIRSGVTEQIENVQIDSNHHRGVGAVIGGFSGLGIGSLIMAHPYVIGEAACGNLRKRDEVLSLFRKPDLDAADTRESTTFPL